MAAISDPEKKLDLSHLAKGLKSSLPVYARPLFVRILPETPLTATFKLKKKELMEQGFSLTTHKDPMFFLDQQSGEYIPLTQKVYDDLMQGVIRLWLVKNEIVRQDLGFHSFVIWMCQMFGYHFRQVTV